MRRSAPLLVGLVVGSFAYFAGSCGGHEESAVGGGDGALGGGHTLANSGGQGGLGAAAGSGGDLFGGAGGGGPGDVFPEDPIVDASAPPNAASLFGPLETSQQTGGPCLFEPEPGALFPRNWLRPRFRFTPAIGQNLFEIRLSIEGDKDDLTVYTANTEWVMPKDLWQKVAARTQGVPMTMTVRGALYDGTKLQGVPAIGTTGSMAVAPVDATGAIVYWTTSDGSALKAFKVGDENVGVALTPSQIEMPTVGGVNVTCIGCHTSTPDGQYASLTAQSPWGNVLASVEAETVGAPPPFLGEGAKQTLRQLKDLGIHVYSKAHFAPGDRTMVTPIGALSASKLGWIDLEAETFGEGSSYGFLARSGDPRGAGAPAWSHDGKTVVYVSTNAQMAGRLENGDADLYSVPYNDRAGGDATAVPGASDPELLEYYPAFSPDDALIAFTRIKKGYGMYHQPKAEVFVIPSAGGAPVRLAANDPVACTGRQSPGVTNSWPKWAPDTTVGPDGKSYSFLIFSSTRAFGQAPQLFVTAVVRSGDQIETYSAIYLWNQPEGENNHTPAWDHFQIPDELPQ